MLVCVCDPSFLFLFEYPLSFKMVSSLVLIWLRPRYGEHAHAHRHRRAQCRCSLISHLRLCNARRDSLPE